MVQTRAQERAGESGAANKQPSPRPVKKKTLAKRQLPKTEETPVEGSKADEPKQQQEHEPKPPLPKKPKTGEEEKSDGSAEKSNDSNDSKLRSLIDKYGAFPLADTSLGDAQSGTAETVLAHVFNAMLTSTRISHHLAFKTVRCVVEAGYADLSKLEASSWEERTRVLTEGGYTHYRERTATQFGDLATWVREKYDGDLNNLLKEAGEDRDKVRKKLAEIKGLGNVGLDIFCDTIQGVWPSMAPFVDPRSQKVATKVGLDSDVNKLWEAVDKDAKHMCRLAAALTTLRLEKKESEFQ